jgi:hypothetical protein
MARWDAKTQSWEAPCKAELDAAVRPDHGAFAPYKPFQQPVDDEAVQFFSNKLRTYFDRLLPPSLASPPQTCECAKEKFAFEFHERWCPDWKHPFDIPAEPAPLPVPDYRTYGDEQGVHVLPCSDKFKPSRLVLSIGGRRIVGL